MKIQYKILVRQASHKEYENVRIKKAYLLHCNMKSLILAVTEYK